MQVWKYHNESESFSTIMPTWKLQVGPKSMPVYKQAYSTHMPTWQVLETKNKQVCMFPAYKMQPTSEIQREILQVWVQEGDYCCSTKKKASNHSRPVSKGGKDQQ